jgi:hypothetical protein
MIDYLLKFPSKSVAEQFGIANGFAVLNEETGKVVSNLASYTHSLHEIGDHNNNGEWWVLFRDLVGIPIPLGGDQFIYWSSSLVDENGVSIPRPTSNPNVPTVFWADETILPNNDFVNVPPSEEEILAYKNAKLLRAATTN